jgi:predicted permease
MINDFFNAFRQWLRTPVVTSVALLSLALGIGANIALFAIVDALLLKSLPVRDPAALVRIMHQPERFEPMPLTVASRVWEYARDHQPFAESVLATATGRVNLARGGEARFVQAMYISGAGIATLGVEPAVGRAIQPEDDTQTSPPVAMISYGLWQRDYSADPAVLGQTLWVENLPFIIVGVTPPAFFGLEVGQQAEVVLPLATDGVLRRAASTQRRPQMQWLELYARLRPGQSADDATTALRAWLPSWREATLSDATDAASHLAAPPYATSGARGDSALRRQYERPLLVLLAAVGLVLTIACANLAALVLARFTDRRHELGVRLALGAGRARLIRMLLAESVLLSMAGAAIGVVVAHTLVTAMVPYLTTAVAAQPSIALAIDARLIAFTAVVAMLSGGLAGLLPAWRASRVTPQASLASNRGAMPGQRGTRTLRVMVTAQVAVSLVLVAGAAVMVRSFVGLTTTPTGVDADHVLIASVSGTLAGAEPSRRYEMIEELRRSLRSVPGVRSVSGGMITPLSSAMAAAQIEVPGSIYKPVSPEGAMVINGRATAFVPFNRVLPTYFATVGTPILMGRDFDERDRPGTPPVAVVNQAFATRHFGDANPIGRTIVTSGETLEIVGLAADAKVMSLKDPQPIPMAFGAFTQLKGTSPISRLRFAINADDPESLRSVVANVIRTVDPRLAIEFRTMRDEADATVNRERLMAWMAGIFAALGLVMAVIGLYGTFTYAVTRRRPEIGVRMAVGADRTEILRMIMREAGVVLVAGMVAGVAGALAAGQVLQSLLFSVSARDPWMLATAVASVIGAAGLASLIPARRASQTDPMVALRDE